jgi:predicted CXXCH cytochrome family protein
MTPGADATSQQTSRVRPSDPRFRAAGLRGPAPGIGNTMAIRKSDGPAGIAEATCEKCHQRWERPEDGLDGVHEPPLCWGCQSEADEMEIAAEARDIGIREWARVRA